MIQIRHSCFETNSSSANILIMPKDQGIKVPTRFIFVDDDTSLKPSEKVICEIINGFKSNKEDIDKIINFLYESGVEEIIYGGHNYYFENAIEMYKDHHENMGVPDGWTEDEFRLALFGTYSEIESFAEGETRPIYGDGEDEENYYRTYSVD